MKITIIGGGNMGGAIARGLSQGDIFQAKDITVIDICQSVLNELTAYNKDIQTYEENDEAIKSADIVVIALKPWLVENLLDGIKYLLDYDRQIIISVAAGVTFEQLKHFLKKVSADDPTVFRVIPNTGISVKESMTFISSDNASETQEKLVCNIFNSLGKSMLVDEKYMSAGTALGSCGIAYAFRYIRAAMEAGVEIGFYPEQAKTIVLQTLKGAIDLMLENNSHPEVEIDKVTTPGGITIKGLNAMEKNGFTNALIEGIKASNI